MALLLRKGYKQGRAVMFYDISAIDGSCARQMVPKDEIVKMCDNGEIGNAKIQWWEGKAIVRCADKHLPLVKVDETGTVTGTATQSVRGANRIETGTSTKTVQSTVSTRKLATKAPKRNISFDAYANEKPALKLQNIPGAYNGIETVSDLFDMIANDFKVRQVDDYKREFSKKIDMSKRISSLTPEYKGMLQHSIATYLMNMVYDEVAEIYIKYRE